MFSVFETQRGEKSWTTIAFLVPTVYKLAVKFWLSDLYLPPLRSLPHAFKIYLHFSLIGAPICTGGLKAFALCPASLATPTASQSNLRWAGLRLGAANQRALIDEAN